MQHKMNRRTKKFFRLGIVIAFLLFCVIYTALTSGKPDENYPLTIFLLTAAGIVCLIYVVFQIPAVKGAWGEKIVSFFINKAKNKDDILVNDVIVPGDDGKTSQIDHVLVSTKGIFVIETKNMSGRIYGSANELKWMQVLNYGKVKNQFYSPLKQNETHIYRLQNVVGNHVSMKNCVVFAQSNVDYIKADVYYPYSLYKTIKTSPNTVLSTAEIQSISNQIIAYKKNPIQTNKEHVQKIHSIQENIKNNICPRCGGKLVLRHGRDGHDFYGCENYPKCKFTKNI